MQAIETREMRRVATRVILLLLPPKASIRGCGEGMIDIPAPHTVLVRLCIQRHHMVFHPFFPLASLANRSLRGSSQPMSGPLPFNRSRDFFREAADHESGVVVLRPHPLTGPPATPDVVHDEADSAHVAQRESEQAMRGLRTGEEMRVQFQVRKPWQLLKKRPDAVEFAVALPSTRRLDRAIGLWRMISHETHPRNLLPPSPRQARHEAGKDGSGLEGEGVSGVEDRASFLAPLPAHEEDAQVLPSGAETTQVSLADFFLCWVRARPEFEVPAFAAEEFVSNRRSPLASPEVRPGDVA